MELEEAIDVLKNKIGDYVIADYCKNCHNKADCVDDCNYLLAIHTVLQELEKLQKENEKLKEIDLTTVFMQGVYAEKTRWREKSKKKIQQLKIEEKTRLKGKGCFDRCLILSEYQHKENVLQELLKGE